MRIKQRLEDFRVRELLRADYLRGSGEWRVYRVTKKKLTSLDAARALAREAGVPPADVTMAGLKDRQGITTQFMGIHRGREVTVAERDLKIESVGFAADELTSADSEGNAFEIVVRGLDREDLTVLRANLDLVRAHGVVNYFDEQRFGNLRHGQGWIALELLREKYEDALRQLIATPSEFDDERRRSFRGALNAHWGDWSECRDIAGRFGEHHSVFEYLKKHPDDFAGAFFHVASRVRLIHLYAFQSHLWNRAVANCVRARTSPNERAVIESEEGPLVHPIDSAKLADLGATFRLPGPRLEDVAHPEQRRALEEVLAREKIAAQDFDIRGVSGFQLKGEDRALFVAPAHLRVRPAERDDLNRDFDLVRVRFELPRGAYASLVVRRLLARAGDERRADASPRDERPRASRDEFPRGSRGEHPRASRDERRRDPRPERGGWRGEPRGRAEDRGERGSSRGEFRPSERPPRKFDRGAPQDRRRDDRPGSFRKPRRPGGDPRRSDRRDDGGGPRGDRRGDRAR